MPAACLQYNAACSPKEDKYRRIKLGNPTIQASVVQGNGVDLLLAMGWVADEGGEVLVIPAGAALGLGFFKPKNSRYW